MTPISPLFLCPTALHWQVFFRATTNFPIKFIPLSIYLKCIIVDHDCKHCVLSPPSQFYSNLKSVYITLNRSLPSKIVWFSFLRSVNPRKISLGLQLECALFEPRSHMQYMVTLELEKKARSSEVAYDILLNLLEHNTKQNVSQE